MTTSQGFTAEPSQPRSTTSPFYALGERLAQSPLDPTARRWVLAAIHGDDALAACLRGEQVDLPLPSSGPAPAQPRHLRHCYLRRVRVQGFRGIGRAATLEFPPGPGLTVIVGRNGSGKSSFAEAVEAALTGRNLRWEAMPTAWRDGWRNLHCDDVTEITVELQRVGEDGVTRVTRVWTGRASARPRRSSPAHRGRRRPRQPRLGRDLARYRPFLSYDELGRTITDAPPSSTIR